ncbi:TetR/AcrR family transcriptional regulator [Nonomuraea sp. B10E15]|uniref:TetR/AcrR family transcriptional regulator n=1 Tax=Nonomuraea sp. B10E15 TaxID=3153560 RepID=UPI00325F5CA3
MSQKPEQAGDLRVVRTRAHLRAALVRLAGERGYVAVTVGDIAGLAMVNRATFYRHYEDKEDLAVDVLAKAIEEVGKSTPVHPGWAGGNQLAELDSRIAGAERLFEHFAEHRRMYQPLLGYPRNRRFMIRARELLGGGIAERIDTAEPDPDQARMPMTLIPVFAAELFLGMIAWWLDRSLPYSPRQMADWSIRFLFYGYFGALGLDHRLPDDNAT